MTPFISLKKLNSHETEFLLIVECNYSVTQFYNWMDKGHIIGLLIRTKGLKITFPYKLIIGNFKKILL